MNKRAKLFAVLTTLFGVVSILLMLSPYVAWGIFAGCLAVVFFGVSITETN